MTRARKGGISGGEAAKSTPRSKAARLVSDYLLPYQKAWINDKSRFKIWEKARRIGATYVQALEDVLDCMNEPKLSVWFSSSDDSAAHEYILYCEKWGRMANAVSSAVSTEIIDEEKAIKSYSLAFLSGSRIHAMSSNPQGFRSKGGKVVLDEFAWHKHADAMWDAASPVVTWGHRLRILSTHNGKQSLFYRFLQDIDTGKLNWSRHRIPIQEAVEQGLADKIERRKLTKAERLQWLENLRASCHSEDTWRQEFCCEPVDEATAFLPFEMITACEVPAAAIIKPLDKVQGDIYLGFDVGRKKDLSVIFAAELFGDKLIACHLWVLSGMPFSEQRELLFSILRNPQVRRICIDATGLGMNLAEDAQAMFGIYKVEAITFSNPVKEELATDLRIRFEDRSIVIPADGALRDDLHSVCRVVTTAGNTRFDVSRSDTDGHADRFWALALCCHAAKGAGAGAPAIKSGRQRDSVSLFRGY